MIKQGDALVLLEKEAIEIVVDLAKRGLFSYHRMQKETGRTKDSLRRFFQNILKKTGCNSILDLITKYATGQLKGQFELIHELDRNLLPTAETRHWNTGQNQYTRKPHIGKIKYKKRRIVEST